MMRTTLQLLLFALILVTLSCDSDAIENVPVNTDVVDAELYDLIKRVPTEDEDTSINCIEFNYWFNLFIFDENMELVDTTPIISNEQFSEVLGSIQEDYSISLSYPITGTLSTGETIEITNNEELKESIDSCQEEEILTDCNNALSKENCLWNVKDPNNPNGTYSGSYFKIEHGGNATFYINNEAYFGSWTTYFIEDQLHLNIFLNDNGTVGNDWNFDWELQYTSDTAMIITNDENSYNITIDCSLPCEETTYTTCEFENNPGFAEFNLYDYLACLEISPFSNQTETVQFSFYETEEDAENDTNQVLAESYVNTTNPQQIFVRAEDDTSGNIVNIFQFTVEAIFCEE